MLGKFLEFLLSKTAKEEATLKIVEFKAQLTGAPNNTGIVMNSLLCLSRTQKLTHDNSVHIGEWFCCDFNPFNLVIRFFQKRIYEANVNSMKIFTR